MDQRTQEQPGHTHTLLAPVSSQKILLCNLIRPQTRVNVRNEGEREGVSSVDDRRLHDRAFSGSELDKRKS